MATYKNRTIFLKEIRFSDDSAVFLTKGQKFSTNKKIKKVDDGIVEVKPKVANKSVKKQEVVENNEE